MRGIRQTLKMYSRHDRRSIAICHWRVVSSCIWGKK